MRTAHRILLFALTLSLAVTAVVEGEGGREDAPPPGWVTLPLEEYLALTSAAARGDGEEAVAELVSEEITVTVQGGEALLESTFRVELRGAPERPLPLLFAGVVESATVEPRRGAALHHERGGEVRLVAPEPGTYRVTLRGRQALAREGGVESLSLAPVVAPVATTKVDLPADLAWSVEGAVVVTEAVAGERRRLELALPRGRDLTLELKRRLAREDDALARAVVVTVVDLAAGGELLRHDAVFYDVQRGGLEEMAVALPPDLVPDEVVTDEGAAAPLVEGDRLAVRRVRRLTGAGHMLVTSRPAERGGAVALEAVEPEVETRARYLVLRAAAAAAARPLPADAWLRVDAEDLPAALRRQLAPLAAGAAWRFTRSAGAAGRDVEAPRLALDPLPPVAANPALVRERHTTTLLTAEGTLLHRERFAVTGGPATLDLRLPAAATLWSAQVDGAAVRPVERGGALVVPLALGGREEATVEVVAVAHHAVPAGRSHLLLRLPEVTLPVLVHSWRLLLPEEHRYRFAGGDLRPAPLPLVATSREVGIEVYGVSNGGGGAEVEVTVTAQDGGRLPGAEVEVRCGGEKRSTIADSAGKARLANLPVAECALTCSLDGFVPLRATIRPRSGRRLQADCVLRFTDVTEEIVVYSEAQRRDDESSGLDGVAERMAGRFVLDELRQGLVGGVRPVEVAIPESGKLLLLTGALPPAAVKAELEVRARR